MKPEERISLAFKAVEKEYAAKGIPTPSEANLEFFKAIEKHLSHSEDKMLLAVLSYALSSGKPEAQRQTLEWAKKIYADSNNDDRIFSAMTKDFTFLGSTAKLIQTVSPKAYQTYLDNDPAAYYKARSEIEASGADISQKPSTQSIEAVIKNLPANSISAAMLEDVQDPDIKASVRQTLDRSPFYAREVIEKELRQKKKNLPYDEELIKNSLKTATGYDASETSPVAVGSLQISVKLLREYITQLSGEAAANDVHMALTKRDPLIGMNFAARNYPHDKASIPLYLAALPRANEMLDNVSSASVLVSMMNALEPSQYAGQPYKIIPEKDVFKILDGATSEQLYDLISQQGGKYSYGMSQGVYNEASKRLYDQLKIDKKNLTDVANSTPERSNALLHFVEMADTYQRMDHFLKATTPEDHHAIIQKLFEKEDTTYNISAVSTFIKHLPKNSQAITYVESTIITKALGGSEYDKADMGILARWYATQSGHTPSPENRGFFDRVSQDPSFAVPPLNSIKSKNLLDAAGRNFQLHAFYNDKDGIDTFKSFSASLKADGYSSVKKDDFIVFSKERNGKKIEILASPPESDGEAIPKILEYVKAKNGVISVLSGRGHAHHMEKAVELITPDTKIVALGGCWGHGYTQSVLDKSPDAHILATTGVGRMSINNFNTKWINDQIISGKDLNWQGLKSGWERLKGDKTIRSDIAEYVSPDDNVFLLYERKRTELHTLIREREQATPDGAEMSKVPSDLNKSFMQSVRGDPVAVPAPTSSPGMTISQVQLLQEMSHTA